MTLDCLVFPLLTLLAQQPAPYAVDGDTLQIGLEVIRLEGIDAPEHEQLCETATGEAYACGVRATAALRRLLKAGPVTCQPDGTDRYGRTLAHCQAGGLDINREMIRRGWAVAFVRYSTEYVVDELDARQACRGLWKGSFQLPWEWRKTHR